MKKILAFAGSNSSKSINKRLIEYTSKLVENNEIKILELNEFDVPIYGSDLQNEIGIPENITKLKNEFENADVFIIATPEHNGMISAFLKNIFDWLSRAERKILKNKPTLLLSTSPGRSGGKRAIDNLETFLGDFDGNVIGKFSLPSFNHTFSEKIIDEELDNELKNLVKLIDQKQLQNIF